MNKVCTKYVCISNNYKQFYILTQFIISIVFKSFHQKYALVCTAIDKGELLGRWTHNWVPCSAIMLPGKLEGYMKLILYYRVSFLQR